MPSSKDSIESEAVAAPIIRSDMDTVDLTGMVMVGSKYAGEASFLVVGVVGSDGASFSAQLEPAQARLLAEMLLRAAQNIDSARLIGEDE